MNFYVLSARCGASSPAQCCVNEFEDILVNTLSAKLVCPRNENDRLVEVCVPDAGKEQIVFVICISISTAYKLLASIKDWRRIFDRVIIYVFDSYPTASGEMGWLKKRLSKSVRALNEVDHIFVALGGGVERFERDFEVPISFVPLAADVLKFGSGHTNRCISVNGYGRQNVKHSNMFSEYFNDIQGDASYFHTNHAEIGKILDSVAHRRQFWKFLSKSSIAMAYDPMVVNRIGDNAFSFSFIGQRWFESLAAGCLVVGRRPTCPEVKECLDWEDATVELPEDDEAVIPFIVEILGDSDRLASAHKRNYMNSLLKNDWRHRLVDIFTQLNLVVPQAIQNELQEMALEANRIQRDI